MNFDEAPAACPACERTNDGLQISWCPALGAWLCIGCRESWSLWDARNRSYDGRTPHTVEIIEKYVASLKKAHA
jgi:hypothetical protein